MSWLKWLSKDPSPQEAQNQKKILAENTQALAGMEDLVRKLDASNQQDANDAASMQRYLQRLRQEGSGR